MDLLISVGIAILLFLCGALGFRTGLRLGMRSAKGIPPAPIKNPVTAVKEAVKEHKDEAAAKERQAVYDAFENYDGYTDKERAWIKGGGKR